MTPAEQGVVAAARAMVHGDGNRERLERAVKLLEAERLATEAPLKWSQVVAEDEIYSVKHQRWYRVLATERLDLIKSSPAKVRVTMDGADPVTVPADATVQVRRSEMGNAVDVWGGLNPEVISS